jgi:adenosylhomocysteine nucleosidase
MKDILILAAFPSELCGPMATMEGLYQGADVVFTGLGKVNAAHHVSKAIAIHRPKLVVNFGTAGGPSEFKGQVVNCTSFFQRDMDCSAMGFQKCQTPGDTIDIFPSNGIRFEDFPEFICATGDSFVTDIGKYKQAYDMEAYAIAKCCLYEAVPFACFKYISDAGDPADWSALVSGGIFKFREIYSDTLIPFVSGMI